MTEASDGALESAHREVEAARNVFSRIISTLYQKRETPHTYDFIQRDAEKQRMHFDEWLQKHTHEQGSMKERVSTYIITQMHLPALTTLVHEYKKDQHDWNVATAYVNTWKLIEVALNERFSAMPDGEMKQALTQSVTTIRALFSTTLPEGEVKH